VVGIAAMYFAGKIYQGLKTDAYPSGAVTALNRVAQKSLHIQTFVTLPVVEPVEM